MCQRQKELVGLPLQCLYLPLNKGSSHTDGCLLGEFEDSPRDQVLATLAPVELPRESLQLPLQSLESGPDGSPRDEFEDSPRDKILAYLDGDDSASPWRFREAPQFPNLLSAQHAAVPRSRKSGRKGRAQAAAAKKYDSSSSCKDQPGAERPSAEQPSAEQPRSEGPAAEAEEPGRSPEPAAASDSAPTASGEGSEHSDGASTALDWPEDATTVMLRNIPNRYTVEELIAEMLTAGFEGSFDFFYLPIDFTTKRNRGYSFINFRNPSDAQRFVGVFHRQRLTRYATQKILEVSPAITQGLEGNIAQFVKKDAQRIQNPWFRPMIFHGDGDDRAMAETAR